jgi:5-methylcytosine-specific restriction enzyme subunit McrC
MAARGFRTYQVVEDELPVLRGKWRIAEQLRRPYRQHVFPVAYDEFTADNSLNRVFRFVLERLWRLTRDSGNRQMLGELRQWMEEVTVLPHVTAADANASLLTRLTPASHPCSTSPDYSLKATLYNFRLVTRRLLRSSLI